jgi:Rrf2 family protein
MKMTNASRYGIAALVHLARQKPNTPLASHQIAQLDGTPERFLLKVLKSLVSAGILRSLKGPNGGYLLARPPQDVNLLEIVEAIDGPVRGRTDLAGIMGADGLSRKLQNVCEEAADEVRRVLQKVRLTELAKGK